MFPTLPIKTKQGESVSFSSNNNSSMSNVVYLNRKSGMSHEEIMNLPYGVYLKYIEQHIYMDLMETEEGREYLQQVKRLQVKDADLTSLRSMAGYTAKQKGGES